MWIRDQHKKVLQELNGFNFEVINGKYIMEGWKDTWRCPIGSYKTKEQVLEILDEIQDRINEGCPYVYQMPEDNENKELEEE